jgi:hypothetical protein
MYKNAREKHLKKHFFGVYYLVSQDIVHSIALSRLTDSGSSKGGYSKPRPAGKLIRPARQAAKEDTSPSPKCGALHLVKHHFVAAKFSTLSRLARVSSIASHGIRDRAIRPSCRFAPLGLVRDVALYRRTSILALDRRGQTVLGPVRERELGISALETNPKTRACAGGLVEEWNAKPSELVRSEMVADSCC